MNEHLTLGVTPHILVNMFGVAWDSIGAPRFTAITYRHDCIGDIKARMRTLCHRIRTL